MMMMKMIMTMAAIAGVRQRQPRPESRAGNRPPAESRMAATH
jgi:hypothetical protein